MRRSASPWRGNAIGAALVAALALCAPCAALAQTASALNCSGTVSTAAAAITFANGAPKQYVFIANPHASNVLWINASNGTAAANTAASFPLLSTGASVTLPPLPVISIIASGSSTPYTCFYK